MKRIRPFHAAMKIARLAGRIKSEFADRIKPTYRRRYATGGQAEIRRLLEPVTATMLHPFESAIKKQAEQALEHVFDLLGSGTVKVMRGTKCGGLEGIRCGEEAKYALSFLQPLHRNGAESERVAARMKPGYEAIDWQVDFKSGYRWKETRWFKSIRPSPARGADIKVPWELGRMQHLASLVWAFILARSSHPDFGPPVLYLNEFRDQILDFISSNPPRFGVQWNCAMEVAIRVTNWLICRDLILAAGAEFDPEFERLFLESVHEHGSFIRRNLERYGEERNNHYLSDLVGLACCAAYLPHGPESLEWGEFAMAELATEIEFQFHRDGTNFEGSTAYHCFSSEMAAYGLAFSMRFAADWKRGDAEGRLAGSLAALEKMAEFIMAITKDDGGIPLIGDNDSGCFLKLTPGLAFQGCGFGERGGDTDKRFVVAALDGLVNRKDFLRFTGDSWLERRVTKQIAGLRPAAPLNPGPPASASGRLAAVPIGKRSDFEAYFEDADSGIQRISEFESSSPDGIATSAFRIFEEFGLYLYRGGNLYLAVRCGPSASKGNRGHFHNDQLSIELILDGRELATDPGTFVYTPLPERRNEYRSNAAHFVPFAYSGIEQEALTNRLFRLGHASRTECLFADKDGFLGRIRTGSHEVWRGIQIGHGRIVIKDVLKGEIDLDDLHRRERTWSGVPVAIGYGKLSGFQRTVDFDCLVGSKKGSDGIH